MFGDNLLGLQHIGLPIRNIEQSKAFYERLGFTEVMARALPQGNSAIQVSMMEHDGLVLELYQLTGAELEEIKQRGHGHIDHIALDVRDINKAYQTASAAGLQPEQLAPVALSFWEKGVFYFSILGPDGERVEFNQRLA